jgi:hypothetical protein
MLCRRRHHRHPLHSRPTSRDRRCRRHQSRSHPRRGPASRLQSTGLPFPQRRQRCHQPHHPLRRRDLRHLRQSPRRSCGGPSRPVAPRPPSLLRRSQLGPASLRARPARPLFRRQTRRPRQRRHPRPPDHARRLQLRPKSPSAAFLPQRPSSPVAERRARQTF